MTLSQILIIQSRSMVLRHLHNWLCAYIEVRRTCHIYKFQNQNRSLWYSRQDALSRAVIISNFSSLFSIC